MPAGKPPALAVVIGTYNRLNQLKACLRSIREQTSAPHEVWVADAGSDDGTVAFLERAASKDPHLHPVFERERVGQARALNAIFARVEAPYICWLSDDNLVINRGLDLALDILDDSPRLGMVGLKVRDVRGPFANAPYIGGITATGVLNVNQGMLRTGLLKKLGGFSETFRDYGIDADLTTRVLLAGYEVAYTRPVTILHQRNWPEPGTPEAEHLAARNRRYRDIYWREFGPHMGTDGVWRVRRALWKAVRLLVHRWLPLDHPRPVLGFLMRDWHNMIACRFISLGRELTNRHGAIHLLQRPPRRGRARGTCIRADDKATDTGADG